VVKNVQLVGESAENTIITYDDHANINKMGTFRTYTVKVYSVLISQKTAVYEHQPVTLGMKCHGLSQRSRIIFNR